MRTGVLLVLSASMACTHHPPAAECNSDPLPVEARHILHFGFVAVDCTLDDHSDVAFKDWYGDEVAGFTNVAHLCVFEPGTDIRARVERLNGLGIKAMVDLQAILFRASGRGPSARTELHPDHQARWSQFLSTNAAVLDTQHVTGLYLADEPYLNKASADDVAAAARVVKAALPAVPLMLVEGYPALDKLVVPPEVDWVAFDRYFVRNPVTDSTYQQDLATLKSKLSTPEQRLWIVLDSQWRTDNGGISRNQMKEVAQHYWELATQLPEVVGIMGYLWPGTLDLPFQQGARDLPDGVIREYQRFGCQVVNTPR